MVKTITLGVGCVTVHIAHLSLSFHCHTSPSIDALFNKVVFDRIPPLRVDSLHRLQPLPDPPPGATMAFWVVMRSTLPSSWNTKHLIRVTTDAWISHMVLPGIQTCDIKVSAPWPYYQAMTGTPGPQGSITVFIWWSWRSRNSLTTSS